ncbi:TPA: rod shape-determining protein RodA [Candidatus Uhrbacteria bacterium]|nr:MAG: Rod shape-determining protein RodA [Parcubacteria group bacterium GW2011_GWA2_53_21]HBL39333.1 rod shape-determining protein RodA [Candidatus Uhrbacteria bacterium]
MRSNFLRQFDWWMGLSVLVLVAFGFAAIYSVALSQSLGEFISLKKQAIALGIGLVLIIGLVGSNYRVLLSFSPHLYVLGILLLLAVLFFGETVRGTTGWFRLGGFSFQPVEFMKLALILVLARYFSGRQGLSLRWREIFATGGLALFPSALVLFQPDLGSAFVLIATWGVLLLFARVSKRQLLILLGIAIFLAAAGWQFGLADYQKARLTSFLDPASDPLGQGYNVAQSVIAVGSGQWFGRGLGFGSQSQLRFLPEAHTDFVLAVIAEELGFVGLALVFAAFAVLFWRLGLLASRAADGFTVFLVLGIGTTVFLQFAVNVGMNLGLMPVTGITLPFVSYGGSSLVLFLVMIGIVESASLRLSVFQERDRMVN